MKQLEDKTFPLKPKPSHRTFYLLPSVEGGDRKVANTKYTNYRSVDQSHQNSAIRAEATSLSLPWRISLFYHRQAKRLEIFKLSWKGNNRHGMVTATATVCQRLFSDFNHIIIIMIIIKTLKERHWFPVSFLFCASVPSFSLSITQYPSSYRIKGSIIACSQIQMCLKKKT